MLLLRFRVKMPKSEQTWTGDMVKVIDNMQIVLITCCFIIQSEKQQDRGKKLTQCSPGLRQEKRMNGKLKEKRRGCSVASLCL